MKIQNGINAFNGVSKWLAKQATRTATLFSEEDEHNSARKVRARHRTLISPFSIFDMLDFNLEQISAHLGSQISCNVAVICLQNFSGRRFELRPPMRPLKSPSAVTRKHLEKS